VPVVFDDNGSATPAITITPNDVAPFHVTVSNLLNQYTLGGAAIVGTCGLTKSGTAGLTLNGTNTYSGMTSVNAGTLTVNGVLSNTSIFLANGATFIENETGMLSGSEMRFTSYGTATLAGSNTYDGATTVGINGTGAASFCT